MKMIDLLEVIQDEKRSEDFLRSRGILKTFTHCYKCNSTKVGMTRSDRWKCYSCEAEWTRRKDSILSLVRMKYSEFLLCMKLFELELTAEEAAAQLKLNYRTVQLLFNEFRIVLTAFDIKKIISDKTLLKDEELIYLVEEKEKIFLSYKNETGSGAISLKITRHFIQEGTAYYKIEISNINKMQSLKISKQHLALHKFMRFAKKRLFDFRGTGKKNLLLRLSEIVYRFNNPGVDIFSCLGKQISQNY